MDPTPLEPVPTLPETGALTSCEVLSWLAALSSRLPLLVNPKADRKAQAEEAVRLMSGFMTTARNRLPNAHALAQLGFAAPIPTVDELWEEARRTGAMGDALCQKVMYLAGQAMRSPLELVQPKTVGCSEGGGFLAGTLVHTKHGLKPIEQIQVGDWVLSKPAFGEGEQAYKQVTHATSEEKAVWNAVVFNKTERDLVVARGLMYGYEIMSRIVAEPNQTFWVQGKGWLAFKDIWEFEHLLLENGQPAVVNHFVNLFQIANSKTLAFASRCSGMYDGHLIDIALGEDVENCFPEEIFPEPIESDFENPETYFHTRVFSLAVEDFHTYYVGTKGLWVHQTNFEKRAPNAQPRP